MNSEYEISQIDNKIIIDMNKVCLKERVAIAISSIFLKKITMIDTKLEYHNALSTKEETKELK